MSLHPTREQIEQLLRHPETEGDPSDLDLHIDSCGVCQKVVEEIYRNARNELLDTETWHGDRIARWIQRLKSDSPKNPVSARRTDSTSLGDQDTIGHYRILEQLGRGSTGVVFKAFDDSLGRLVALKVLREELASRTSSRERFEREARSAAQVNSPYVVTTHAVGTTPNTNIPFLVLEYVPGLTLFDYMAQFGYLEIPQAVELVVQLAQGVAAAHAVGVIHRDIKPANVLLSEPTRTPNSEKAQFKNAKLSDFSIARTIEQVAKIPADTGQIVGTPAYMSPEQIHSPDRVDTRSDVYSLGALLYELLAGCQPFEGTRDQILLQVVHRAPQNVRSLSPLVPRSLEIITHKCLAKEPDRRYQSAEELAEDLQLWLDGKSIRGRPLSLFTRTSDWVRANAATAIGSTVICVLIAALVVKLQWEASRFATTKRLFETKSQQDDVRAIENRRLSALLSLDRGISLCESGEQAAGLHWMLRALEQAPLEDQSLIDSLRFHVSVCRSHVHRLKEILPHPSGVNVLAVSPDAKWLASGGDIPVARLWDVSTMSEKYTIGTDGSVSALGFSRDGTQWSAGTVLGSIYTGSVRDPKSIQFTRLQLGGIRSLAFDPSRDRLVCAAAKHFATSLELKNLSTHKPFVSCTEPLTAVAFSPNAEHLLIGAGASARIHDATMGTPVSGFLSHSEAITSVGYRPDGNVIVTAGKDHSLRQWDASTGQPIGPVMRHKGKIYSAEYSYDGSRLVSAGNDSAARLWNAATGKRIGSKLAYPGVAHAAIFHPEHDQVLVGGEADGIWRWEIQEPKASIYSIAGHDSPIKIATPTPDGNFLLTTDHEGRIFTHSLSSRQRVSSSLDQAEGDVLTFSPSGDYLLTAGNRTAVLRHWPSGLPAGLPMAHDTRIRCLAFSPDSQMMATGCNDDFVWIWDVRTCKPRRRRLPHGNDVTAVAFLQDNRTIITAGWSGYVQLWDIESGKLLQGPIQLPGSIIALSVDPKGRWFATGCRDSTVRLWDAQTCQPCLPPMLHPHPVSSLTISPDGSYLVAASIDGYCRIWDTTTGRPIGPELPHPTRVNAITISMDGRTIVTADQEAVVRFWRLPESYSGSISELRRDLERQTALRLDDTGTIHTLTANEWYARNGD